jgi:uncharacterized protein YlxW (UPF0749 family)
MNSGLALCLFGPSKRPVQHGERSMTVRKPSKMDEAEILRRAQEPGDRAAQRLEQARSYVETQTERDDATLARMEKLKALRLAAAASGAQFDAPSVKAGPAKKAAGAKKATKASPAAKAAARRA